MPADIFQIFINVFPIYTVAVEIVFVKFTVEILLGIIFYSFVKG